MRRLCASSDCYPLLSGWQAGVDGVQVLTLEQVQAGKPAGWLANLLFLSSESRSIPMLMGPRKKRENENMGIASLQLAGESAHAKLERHIMYINVYIYNYIYIYRERERDRIMHIIHVI